MPSSNKDNLLVGIIGLDHVTMYPTLKSWIYIYIYIYIYQ